MSESGRKSVDAARTQKGQPADPPAGEPADQEEQTEQIHDPDKAVRRHVDDGPGLGDGGVDSP